MGLFLRGDSRLYGLPPKESKMVHKPIIRGAVGLIHLRWLSNPKRVAIIAVAWYLAVITAAAALGILWTFPDRQQRQILGFWSSPNWGPLYLVAMPLAALLVGFYLRYIENALQSIDDVVLPVAQQTAEPFSSFVSGRLRYAWAAWIFPVALFSAVILALTAVQDRQERGAAPL